MYTAYATQQRQKDKLYLWTIAQPTGAANTSLEFSHTNTLHTGVVIAQKFYRGPDKEASMRENCLAAKLGA
jgi:hypothetical protein